MKLSVRAITIMMALTVCLGMKATEIVQTEHLTFYYPHFKSIDLALGKMPDMNDAKVEFCCESMSTRSTRLPLLPYIAARVSAVVVFPVPPF